MMINNNQIYNTNNTPYGGDNDEYDITIGIEPEFDIIMDEIYTNNNNSNNKSNNEVNTISTTTTTTNSTNNNILHKNYQYTLDDIENNYQKRLHEIQIGNYIDSDSDSDESFIKKYDLLLEKHVNKMDIDTSNDEDDGYITQDEFITKDDNKHYMILNDKIQKNDLLQKQRELTLDDFITTSKDIENSYYNHKILMKRLNNIIGEISSEEEEDESILIDSLLQKKQYSNNDNITINNNNNTTTTISNTTNPTTTPTSTINNNNNNKGEYKTYLTKNNTISTISIEPPSKNKPSKDIYKKNLSILNSKPKNSFLEHSNYMDKINKYYLSIKQSYEYYNQSKESKNNSTTNTTSMIHDKESNLVITNDDNEYNNNNNNINNNTNKNTNINSDTNVNNMNSMNNMNNSTSSDNDNNEDDDDYYSPPGNQEAHIGLLNYEYDNSPSSNQENNDDDNIRSLDYKSKLDDNDYYDEDDVISYNNYISYLRNK
jgi:hypothetical protein